MPRNIEIKARLASLQDTEKLARALSDGEVTVLEQEDVFFADAEGRLKLRIFPDQHGELIHYHRPDQDGPKTSSYLITPTADPAGLREALSRAYGVRAVVKKRRRLYLVGRTRIHLDLVEGLGEFLELEVVLAEDESLQDGQREAEGLMEQLDITAHQLVADAYVDLLERIASPEVSRCTQKTQD